jgi:hypothetical protein
MIVIVPLVFDMFAVHDSVEVGVVLTCAHSSSGTGVK